MLVRLLLLLELVLQLLLGLLGLHLGLLLLLGLLGLLVLLLPLLGLLFLLGLLQRLWRRLVMWSRHDAVHLLTCVCVGRGEDRPEVGLQ